MDRLRHLIGGALACALLWACPAEEPAERAPSRFAAVKKDEGGKAAKAARAFCEKTFPADGDGASAWAAPPEKPVPGPAAKGARAAASKSWLWVNLWATWCGPCMKEMPLLVRWRDTLEKEGVPVRFELWSVDEDGAALERLLGKSPKLPGPVRWVRSPDDLPELLARLGVDASTPIPIHALVDESGKLRCVRVGSVAESAYGQVRAMLAGG